MATLKKLIQKFIDFEWADKDEDGNYKKDKEGILLNYELDEKPDSFFMGQSSAQKFQLYVKLIQEAKKCALSVDDIIRILDVEHLRTNCDETDEVINNGFYSRDDFGNFRCMRCALLQVKNGEEIPEELRA